jgi:uncharacterized LabA/DUF88 family protein
MTAEPYFGFVDGAYLRSNSLRVRNEEFFNPRNVVAAVGTEAGLRFGPFDLHRTLYFDAIPDPSDTNADGTKPATRATDQVLQRYFEAIEKLVDTEVRFGWVRGRPDGKQRRQKAVDIHLAVDMLAAAADKLFRFAVLISGDVDFVPLVYEVKRRGIRVIVGGFEETTGDLLRNAADRFIDLNKVGIGTRLEF